MHLLRQIWLNGSACPMNLVGNLMSSKKMAVLTEGTGKKQLSLYVWRFKNQKEKHSFPGISGVYQLTGEPAPVRGSETFSRFDRWDLEDAMGHANLCLGTLKEWRTAWANESPKKSPVKKRK